MKDRIRKVLIVAVILVCVGTPLVVVNAGLYNDPNTSTILRTLLKEYILPTIH